MLTNESAVPHVAAPGAVVTRLRILALSGSCFVRAGQRGQVSVDSDLPTYHSLDNIFRME